MVLKRSIYIGLFIVLGIVVQFIIHAIVEMAAITLLLHNFDRYGLGLSWHAWEWIHHIGSILLLVGGILVGWQQGRKWWHRIYQRN